MKKKIGILAIACIMAFTSVACGSKDVPEQVQLRENIEAWDSKVVEEKTYVEGKTLVRFAEDINMEDIGCISFLVSKGDTITLRRNKDATVALIERDTYPDMMDKYLDENRDMYGFEGNFEGINEDKIVYKYIEPSEDNEGYDSIYRTTDKTLKFKHIEWLEDVDVQVGDMFFYDEDSNTVVFIKNKE